MWTPYYKTHADRIIDADGNQNGLVAEVNGLPTSAMHSRAAQVGPAVVADDDPHVDRPLC
ncbi:MAG: hypothetical protein H0X58_05575 [Acidimicrobiia bacterium]|nr:hypothetical protein [Acidimicrobiia bacterium]